MIRYLTLLITLILIVGCRSRQPIEQPAPPITNKNTAQSIAASIVLQSEAIAAIDQANQQTKTSVEDIRKLTDESSTQASSIVARTEDAAIVSSVDTIINQNQKIKENANLVQASTEKIQVNVENAAKQNVQLNQEIKSVDALQNKIVQLEKERDQFQSDAIKNLYTTLSFFFGLGFLTIVAGLVLAFLVNKKLGLSIAGLGLMGVALAAGAIYYMKTIALVAIVIIIAAIVVCVALGVWHTVHTTKEKKILEQANVENVQLVQKIKERLDPNAKLEIFGEYKPGLASTIQSDRTRDIVKKVRDKIDTGGV